MIDGLGQTDAFLQVYIHSQVFTNWVQICLVLQVVICWQSQPGNSLPCENSLISSLAKHPVSLSAWWRHEHACAHAACWHSRLSLHSKPEQGHDLVGEASMGDVSSGCMCVCVSRKTLAISCVDADMVACGADSFVIQGHDAVSKWLRHRNATGAAP